MKIIPALVMAASFLAAQTCPAQPADFYQDAMKGGKMNAAQAAELETALEAKPDDVPSRTKLLGYYFGKGFGPGQALKNRRKHVLWIIRNQPGSKLASLPYCRMDGVFDPEGYMEAKRLWQEQAEGYPKDPKVLGHAAAFFLISDRDLAEGFLKRAQKVEPDSPEWSDDLGHLYSMADDKESALKSLAEYEKAQASDHKEMSRFYRLDSLAKAAIKAEDLEKATRYAKESLEGAERFPKDWNHGNALHHGNNVLGLVALKQGDFKLAAEHLMKAGKTPGSPQLNSFGPNMILAKALLEKDGKDAVLEYFELCRKFWKMGGERLDQWTKDVKAGNVPDFGGNLAY
jgi:tetratricopeptide (TPR) repeat protein